MNRDTAQRLSEFVYAYRDHYVRHMVTTDDAGKSSLLGWAVEDCDFKQLLVKRTLRGAKGEIDSLMADEGTDDW